MPFTNTTKNDLLNTLRGVSYSESAVYVSAHTANPGSSGASEVSGGSYARQAITFSAAASGAMAASNQPALAIPASTTVTHLGVWDAVSGGNFLGTININSATFTNAGTLTLTSLTINAN